MDFDRLGEVLVAALNYGGSPPTHTLDDLWQMICLGHLQFWPGRASAVVTELITYPQVKDLHFFLAGGKLEELREMYPSIIEWGRAQGCARATLAGRAGWMRSFLTKEEGWEPAWTVLAKEL